MTKSTPKTPGLQVISDLHQQVLELAGDLQNSRHCHLVGIKGVGMTALAQCLLDAGKTVSGSDVAQDFVTSEVLSKLDVTINTDFSSPLPNDVDCLVYTSAHQGEQNPLVQTAIKRGMAVLSQAMALAALATSKKTIAVSGVGGKSTVTAMLAWILSKTQNPPPSFYIGVGATGNLNRTGRWSEQNPYFLLEADEYADNFTVKNQHITLPKLLFLKPNLAICTNLKWDHPDVYKDLNHTKQVFGQFFSQVETDGALVINSQDQVLRQVARERITSSTKLLTFGGQSQDTLQIIPKKEAKSHGRSQAQDSEPINQAIFKIDNKTYEIALKLPGIHNLHNAAAAVLAAWQLGVEPEQSCHLLEEFRSTQRRFELVKKSRHIQCYDDYAHHPHEVTKTLTALDNHFPDHRKIVAFQPHTYSRTKALFDQFVEALKPAPELILLDVFASAREQVDHQVSSQKLATAINQTREQSGKDLPKPVKMVSTPKDLAHYLQKIIDKGSDKPTVILTMGAGDIYEAHHQLSLPKKL